MTGKAEMLRALSGKPPRRVPLMVPMYNDFYARVSGKQLWEFDYGTAQEQFECMSSVFSRNQGVDGFWTWTGMNRGPVVGARVVFEHGEPYAIYDDGRRVHLSDKANEGLWNRTPEQVKALHEQMRIRTSADIPLKIGEIEPLEKVLSYPGYPVLETLCRTHPDKLLFFNHSSIFATATSFLGGLEEAWMATVEQPELFEEILDYLLQRFLVYLEAGAASGAKAVWHCYMQEGANVLSPATWRRLVKPRAAAQVAKAHEVGLKHVAWFLDDCRPLVPDLIEIGVDGLATEQPRVNYECEPGDLRRLAGNSDLCIFGWFWESDLIRGNRQAIRDSLEKQYREAGDGKPFVVCTPGITAEVSQEMVDTLAEETARLTA